MFFSAVLSTNKAQIGYSYDDGGGGGGGGGGNSTRGQPPSQASQPAPLNNNNNSAVADLDYDEDMDLDIQVDVRSLNSEHKHILNKSALEYGMEYGDFVRMLTLDHEEKEDLKRNKLLEAEKAQYSVNIY